MTNQNEKEFLLENLENVSKLVITTEDQEIDFTKYHTSLKVLYDDKKEYEKHDSLQFIIEQNNQLQKTLYKFDIDCKKAKVIVSAVNYDVNKIRILKQR